MKNLLLTLTIFLGLSSAISVKSIFNLKKEVDRVESNYIQVQEDNKKLTLKYNELDDYSKNVIDSLANEVNIKPKQVVKYVQIKVSDRITDTVYVDLTKSNDSNRYDFIENIDCFSIEGSISIKDSVPELLISDLKYDNEINYIVYLERRQWEWWIIKSRLFGKKDAKLEISSKCGKSTMKEIDLIKK